MHPLVDDVVSAYLDLVDAEAAGLVTGLYLEGSVALGDFRPRTSDIDFVAVTAAAPDAATLAALDRVHTRLRERHPRPYFDGAYLTHDDLVHGPAAAVGRPTSHEGHLDAPRLDAPHLDPPRGGRLSPVTWHTLADHGVACRGPAPADLDVWTDADTLAAWQDANLDEYWGRLVARASRPVSKAGMFALTDYAAVWIVTGVSRLHYTLAADLPRALAPRAERGAAHPPGRRRAVALPQPVRPPARRPRLRPDGDRRRPPPVCRPLPAGVAPDRRNIDEFRGVH
jgi:hypothetical protein